MLTPYHSEAAGGSQKSPSGTSVCISLRSGFHGTGRSPIVPGGGRAPLSWAGRGGKHAQVVRGMIVVILGRTDVPHHPLVLGVVERRHPVHHAAIVPEHDLRRESGSERV